MSAPGSSSPSANFTSASPPFDADAMEQTLLYQLTLQRSAAIRSHQQRSTNETNKRQTKRKKQNSDSAACSSTSCSVLENPIVLIEESHPLRGRLAPVCARHPFFERVALPLSLGLPVVVNSSAEHCVSSYQDAQRLARLLRSAAPVVQDASRQSRFLDWSVAPLRLPTTTTAVAHSSSAAEHGDSADDSASSKSVVGAAFTVAKEQLNESLRRYLTDAWMWHRKQHHEDNGRKSASSAEQEESLNHEDAQSTRNIVSLLLAASTGDSTSMTSQYLEEAARFLAKAVLNAASNASRRHDVPRAVWECELPEGRCFDDKGALNEVSSSAGGGEATAATLSSCSIWDGLEEFQSAATAPSDDVLPNHEPHAGTKQRASSALLQPHEGGAVAVPNKKRRRNHHEPVASGTASSLHDVMSEANSLRLLMSLVSELRAEEYITEENPIHVNDIVAAAGAHPWFVKVRNALANTPCLESSLTGDTQKPMDDVTSHEPLLTLRIELQDVLLRL